MQSVKSQIQAYAHGTVQIQIDRVDRHSLGQHADLFPNNALKGVVGDVT